jgi:hypothetical protein
MMVVTNSKDYENVSVEEYRFVKSSERVIRLNLI